MFEDGRPNSESSIEALLASQRLDIDGSPVWINLNGEEHGASFTLLNPCDYKRELAAKLPECFVSHDVMDIPDNPPRQGGPRSSEVHHFTLDDDLAAAINAELSAESLIDRLKHEQQGGIRVSNEGSDAFHSIEEAFLPGKPQWFSRLPPVLEAALSTIHNGKEEMALTGWVNASGATAFNSLHDHGTSAWILVYFVHSGSSWSDKELAPVEVAPGSLLLRTQMVPFSHQYAYVAAPPVPGHIWAFPGYMSHAVLPRACGAPIQATPGLPEHEGRLRISVACNATELWQMD